MSPAARGLILPGIAAAIVTAILVSLGTWQVGRLAWKTELIATMTARTRASSSSKSTVFSSSGCAPGGSSPISQRASVLSARENRAFASKTNSASLASASVPIRATTRHFRSF